ADDDDLAWASLMLGKSLLGQRVSDILAIVQALRNHPATRGASIKIASIGHLTVPAVFAAAADTSIPVVYSARGLVSYASLLDKEDYTEPFANFLPGVLTKID